MNLKIVDHISSSVNQRRARHAVAENERTVLAKKALSITI